MYRGVLAAAVAGLVGTAAGHECSHSPIAGYHCYTKLDCAPRDSQDYFLHWNISSRSTSDNSGVVNFLIEKPGRSGWLSLGWPQTPGVMAGSRAFVYSSSLSAAGWYTLGGKAPNLIQRSSSALVVNTGTSVTTEPTRMFFRINGVPQTDVFQVNLVWSANPTDVQVFPGMKHTIKAGITGLNLLSGEGTYSNCRDHGEKKRVQAHAALMITAWVFVIPLAVIVKRFTKVLGCGNKKCCGRTAGFMIHVVMQICALLLVWAGVGIAWYSFKNETDRGHDEIGNVAVGFLLAQVVLGMVTSLLDVGALGMVHFFLGVVTLALGLTNVFTGALNFGDIWEGGEGDRYVVTAATGISCIFVFALVLECAKLAGVGEPKPTALEEEVEAEAKEPAEVPQEAAQPAEQPTGPREPIAAEAPAEH